MAEQAGGTAGTRRRNMDEAFGLAQMLSDRGDDASALLERAVRRVSSGLSDRFSLLGSVVRESGRDLRGRLRIESPQLPSAEDVEGAGTADAEVRSPHAVDDWSAPGAYSPPGAQETRDPQSSQGPYDPPASSSPDAPPEDALLPDENEAIEPDEADPLHVRAGRFLRDPLLLQALVRSAPEDRSLVYLTVRTRGSASDVAAILGDRPEFVAPGLQVLLAGLDARAEALARDSEGPLFRLASRDEGVPEALARTLDSILAATPPSVAGTVMALSPGKGRAPDAPKSKNPSRGPRRAIRIAFLIISVAALGTLVQRLGSGDAGQVGSADLLEVVADLSSSVTSTFQSRSAEQAERYLLDRLGRRLTIPDIARAPLLGVGESELAGGVSVPVLIFDDGAEGSFAVFALSYAVLDEIGDRLALGEDVLAHIQTEGYTDIHDEGRRKLIVFRNRDDIFVAVTLGDPAELASRIRFPT